MVTDNPNPSKRIEKTMRAKEFFSQCKRTSARIDALIAEKERYTSLAERVTSSLSKDGGGRSTGMYTNRREGYILSAIDLDSKIDDEIQKCVELRRAANEIVGRLKDSRYRDIISWRYFSCMEWPRIAESMNYELSYVYELHGKALLEAQPYIDEYLENSAEGVSE